ncbi:hypothetical protein CC85DRAFT_325889 [Cutaneotrichosporon oleaginosum]|uniref:ferric-chelate reductase (NADPH) n=1 Tax=Cutaneotrichosporon oleaginosum TaxID=879819 RepID=A0A0J0XV66_9TREE|nr:uncharacterized protein CC85DRAFT_325889 [Cutaneotrichosporon oleaginosum]KLT44953.1 hypothetical protein CC85DRAFT_325889 [Cutaneotrichosporon oleaginosum]TXT09642.1 hypothetical protein COLE_03576 [Cutaneotrichosporon oleaginosum]
MATVESASVVTVTATPSVITTTAVSTAITTAVSTAITTAPTITLIASPEPTSSSLSPHDLAWKYIIAHESWPDHPKYRYIYIFWIIVGSIASLYALAHHLRLSGGSIGAAYNKWGMRRHSIRLWPRSWGRAFVLPSNSYLLTIGAVTLSLILLSVLGPDHVLEAKGIMDFTNMGDTGIVKRAIDTFAQLQQEAAGMKIRRAPKPDNTVEELTTHVSWQVAKATWTQGNRWGFMAFAAMPLIVTLALKSSPFGIFTMRWFTGLHWDKVGTFHRAGGWVVWGLCTIHVAVWTVKLFDDYYDGRPMWFAMLTVYRFRFGITAYTAMTLAMALSLRPVRHRSYELFYWSHCVLMFIMMVGALVHHYSIAHWVGIALFLWLGDRLWRMIRYWYINGAGRAKTHATQKFSPNLASAASSGTLVDGRIPSVVDLDPEMFRSPVNIPPGMAHVQLLPSRTVRVSIRTTRPMKWHAGQSILLHLPELSHFQTHPFTISNNDPNEIVLIIKARKGLTRELYNHVLALMEARAAPTQRSSRASSVYSDASLPRLSHLDPVLIRAGVDGPMGSAGRVPWLSYSTALLVCGGSGVTFGLAMTDWLSQEMAKLDGQGMLCRVRFIWIVREYAEITWCAGAMCRFKAALPDPDRLQIDIYVTNGEKSRPMPRSTHSRTMSRDNTFMEKLGDVELEPPRRPFERKDSTDSITSVYGGGGEEEGTTAPQRGFYEGVDPETRVHYNDVVYLTNFEGESDVDDAAEDTLSRALQREGRVRRARSRKLRKRLIQPGEERSPLPSPREPEVEQLHDRPEYPDPDEVGAPRPRLKATTRPGSAYDRPSSSFSTHSVERFEPFKRGPSPAPSLDDESVRNTVFSLSSRTQSMVLLEDTHDGKGHSCAGCGRAGADNLWIDEADYAAALILSENARTGRPKLASIVEEELRNAQGAMIVGTCGPAALGTALRSLVSDAIDPSKLRKGDSRGHVTLYTEDFEM